MNLYRGYVIGTSWDVAIEAAYFSLSDGCTFFHKSDGTITAIYPTNKLIIYEIENLKKNKV